MLQQVVLILNYRKVSKIALNVVAGALDVHRQTQQIPVVLAKSPAQLLSAIQSALQAGQVPVVAWSFYSPGFAENVAQLNALRQHIDDPRVIHLAGGVHASAEPLQTLQAGFDYVAQGEGEQIIVDFMLAVQNNTDLRQVRGIAYCQQGQLHSNGKGEYIDLNDYPPFAAKYRRFNAIEITRGCVFACSFCQTPFVNKARFRHRSVDNIAEHVRRMLAEDISDYRFITPTSLSYGSVDAGVNLAAIEQLLATVRGIIGNDRRLFFGTFPSEIRPEHVTSTALQLLKKYVSNDNIIIGGQSGSNTMLQKIHRGHDVESVQRAVRLSLENGFIPNVDFLFGLPEETPDDAQQTRSLAKQLADLGARIHTHTFMPLPGTPLKRAAAGKVDQDTRHVIRFLESNGKAYGQWDKQQQLAQDLVALRQSHPEE